jgi:hypothetical protein
MLLAHHTTKLVLPLSLVVSLKSLALLAPTPLLTAHNPLILVPLAFVTTVLVAQVNPLFGAQFTTLLEESRTNAPFVEIVLKDARTLVILAPQVSQLILVKLPIASHQVELALPANFALSSVESLELTGASLVTTQLAIEPTLEPASTFKNLVLQYRPLCNHVKQPFVTLTLETAMSSQTPTLP